MCLLLLPNFKAYSHSGPKLFYRLYPRVGESGCLRPVTDCMTPCPAKYLSSVEVRRFILPPGPHASRSILSKISASYAIIKPWHHLQLHWSRSESPIDRSEESSSGCPKRVSRFHSNSLSSYLRAVLRPQSPLPLSLIPLSRFQSRGKGSGRCRRAESNRLATTASSNHGRWLNPASTS